MRGVSVAKNVAAAATVVFAREEAEVLLAGCVVANLGFGVRLQGGKSISMNFPKYVMNIAKSQWIAGVSICKADGEFCWTRERF